jgi:hypothetical protein
MPAYVLIIVGKEAVALPKMDGHFGIAGATNNMYMFKTKNILIIITLTVVIGIEFLVVFDYCIKYFFPEVTENKISSLITEKKQKSEYEIVSVGTWQDEINWARYHIVTEKSLTDEGQIKVLAQKVIEDIKPEDLKLDKVEILFYYNKDVACQAEEAEAKVVWISEKFSVEIFDNKK